MYRLLKHPLKAKKVMCNLFESAAFFWFLHWKFCLNFSLHPNEERPRGCSLRFGIQLDNLDLAPCPCMPDCLPVYSGMPIGGLGSMPMASNRSAYQRLGGPSTFAVASLDTLGSAIHHSCGRIWFGPWAGHSLENVENEFW